jgi:hypothetical protein
MFDVLVSITLFYPLSQNGQRGSLLVYNWPYSVGQNHFFVKMLFK